MIGGEPIMPLHFKLLIYHVSFAFANVVMVMLMGRAGFKPLASVG
jgi:hypothetical protein